MQKTSFCFLRWCFIDRSWLVSQNDFFLALRTKALRWMQFSADRGFQLSVHYLWHAFSISFCLFWNIEKLIKAKKKYSHDMLRYNKKCQAKLVWQPIKFLVCKMFIQFWLQNLEADVSKADSQSLSTATRSQWSEIVFFFRRRRVINSLRELMKTNWQ